MSRIQILFLIAIFGHLLCGYCDCLLTYVPGGGKFDFDFFLYFPHTIFANSRRSLSSDLWHFF